MRRLAQLSFVLALSACAVAQDLDGTPSIFGDAATAGDASGGGGEDTGRPSADASLVDTAATRPDTSTEPEDSFAAPADTSVADTSKPSGDTMVADTAVTKPDTGGPADVGGCAIQGCATGSQDRTSCATARTISRRTAGPLGGYNATISPLLPSSIYDKLGLTCIALGPDQAYKIFMRKGETVTATAADGSDGGSAKYTVVLFESLDCATNVCGGTPAACGASKASLTASADGWVSIVVSGQSLPDFGSYAISVKLAGCKTTDCECP
jgi:hypothetical protein